MRILSTRTIQVITATFLLGSLLARAGQPEPAITPGSEASARKYYSDISKILKGLNPTPAATTLDNLLEFVGYPASADRLESLDPDTLLSPQRASSPDGLGIPIRALGGA